MRKGHVNLKNNYDLKVESFFFNIYKQDLLNIFCLFHIGLCSVFIAVQAFSRCGRQGLLSSCGVQASHCSGF